MHIPKIVGHPPVRTASNPNLRIFVQMREVVGQVDERLSKITQGDAVPVQVVTTSWGLDRAVAETCPFGLARVWVRNVERLRSSGREVPGGDGHHVDATVSLIGVCL